MTPDGYIACGSENNCVYTYYHTMPAPLCKYSFSAPGQSGQEVGFFVLILHQLRECGSLMSDMYAARQHGYLG